MGKKVLVIEDDRKIARFIEIDLQQEGYEVTVRHDGRSGLQQVEDSPPDIVLLDIMLPELNGIEVCRRIRLFSRVPIIMITARDDVSDKIMGLDTGANDYITKPFDIDELLARIRACLRSSEQFVKAEKILTIADLKMDIARHQVTRGGESVDLTKKEFDLLEYLLRNKDIVITRDMIIENIWDSDYERDSNVIDVYIRYLRTKIDSRSEGKLIHTIRGLGYVIREGDDE